MSYYELFNSNASQGSELYHSASSEYELYHHGVKGQKWGVRREKKKAASRKARAKKAGERIKNSGGSKGLAAAKRFGLGYLRNVGQNFIASGAASTTMTIAMNTVSPPIAAAAFATTTAIALTNAGFNIQNIYSTGRDIYDIAKHEDNSEYLAHHGIKGQRWGIRRFQDESGALTGLGKLRSTTDADWHPPKKE